MFVEEKKGNKTKRDFCCDFWRFVSIPPSQAQPSRLLNKIHIGPFLNISQKQFDGTYFILKASY